MRHLPHWDQPGLYQIITYRLSDSVPDSVIKNWQNELRNASRTQRAKELKRRIESYLDAGHGCCALRTPAVADCIVDTWKHFDTTRYNLLEWVVMPNHVHVLIQMLEGCPLGKIVQSWKTYTAKCIQAELVDAGSEKLHPVWMREYWDRYIRDEIHLESAVQYIRFNPVKAGLVARPEDWKWSSAEG
ncbi:MAG: transposase [candidate division Zixibacteria bacterium]|nr:transposase [candidate division Zixibacteria bacterium]